MRQQFMELGCPVRMINGMPDHVHSLFLMTPKVAVSDIIRQIKGSTSHWINKQELITEKFSWQTGYAAYSVSESQVEKVFHYIKNQKPHHAKRGFQQEFDAFIRLYNIETDGSK